MLTLGFFTLQTSCFDEKLPIFLYVILFYSVYERMGNLKHVPVNSFTQFQLAAALCEQRREDEDCWLFINMAADFFCKFVSGLYG